MPVGSVITIDTLMASMCTTTLIQESLWALFPSDISQGGQDNLAEARTDARSIMSPYGSTVCTSFHVSPLDSKLGILRSPMMAVLLIHHDTEMKTSCIIYERNEVVTLLPSHVQNSVSERNPRASTVAQRPTCRGGIKGLNAKSALPTDY
ncbi:hypothetical protein AVEN_131419-1 [Araneus ventricosus]|uniref:Uncharacterized protein n=1 Tax=Araneus ventricosus TaxID=182803 RepID=A0A4Y2JB66_ARAVE|nr:hypothetical protein AVEN_131419-1 [Araneus ventricosus]